MIVGKEDIKSTSLFALQDEWAPGECCKREWELTRTSVYAPMTHCARCLPMVTHTRIGPCLIFSHGGETLTMDLIPTFQVQRPEGSSIMRATVETLLHRSDLERGTPYLQKVLETDGILPESFAKVLAEEEDATSTVAFKLLNYGEKDNFIIRSGQKLRELYVHPQLRPIYVRLKSLNRLVRAGVGSYFIKKVLSLENVIAQLQLQRKDAMAMSERLFVALSHPELRQHFEGKVNFLAWKEELEMEGLTPEEKDRVRGDEIPLWQEAFVDEEEDDNDHGENDDNDDGSDDGSDDDDHDDDTNDHNSHDDDTHDDDNHDDGTDDDDSYGDDTDDGSSDADESAEIIRVEAADVHPEPLVGQRGERVCL